MPRGRPKRGGAYPPEAIERLRKVAEDDDPRNLEYVYDPKTNTAQQVYTPEVPKRDDVDHIYYNVLIPHDNTSGIIGQPTPAYFQEIRSQPLITKPNDWEMSIVRFSVPGSLIPIFIFDPALLLNTVTIEYLAFTSGQITVQYLPNNTLPITDPTYYYVYTYQNYIDMVNQALATAFAVILPNLPAGVTAPPYLIYDPVTKLISFIAQQTYLTNTVQVYMNAHLFNFFDPLEAIFYGYGQPLGKDFQLLIKDNYHNNGNTINPYLQNTAPPQLIPVGAPGAGTAAYVMTQEYTSLFRWNTFQKIVFTTGAIPINAESISAPVNATQIQSNFLPILTDFIPLVQDGFDIRSVIQYYPTAEYRMIDLKSDQPLTNIDLRVFWEDNLQRLYQVYIPTHSCLTVKMLFRKKKNN